MSRSLEEVSFDSGVYFQNTNIDRNTNINTDIQGTRVPRLPEFDEKRRYEKRKERNVENG